MARQSAGNPSRRVPVTDNDPARQPSIAVLSRDVFFGMRIRTALKQLGYAMTLLQSEEELSAAMADSPALALVDFNTQVDWEAIATAVAAHPQVAVIAFGAHTDVEGFRQAKAAGAARVVANRSFSQQLPDLIGRYAQTSRP